MNRQYTKDLLIGLMLWILILQDIWPRVDDPVRIAANVLLLILFCTYMFRLRKDHAPKLPNHPILSTEEYFQGLSDGYHGVKDDGYFESKHYMSGYIDGALKKALELPPFAKGS